jgi:hypothetical protein
MLHSERRAVTKSNTPPRMPHAVVQVIDYIDFLSVHFCCMTDETRANARVW